MPSSPPKKERSTLALEATNSPRPSEIMANTVPLRRVEMAPKIAPKTRPAAPPTSGISTTGIGRRWAIAAFMAWTAKKAPRP